MSDDSESAFVRDTEVDEPGIVGARWWQDSLGDPMPRRNALIVLVAAGGAIAALGAICAISGSSSTSSDGPDFEWQTRRAIDLQRTYGWDFGSVGEAIVFDGAQTQPFDRSALAHLAADLHPADARFSPYYVPTLFESATAHAKEAPANDSMSSTSLGDVLVPMHTPEMEAAYDRGVAFAKLAKKIGGPGTAAIVDLDGPLAVAFAAGASTHFVPVFLFDNWPHPRGVVASHKTLAAVAYYQPLFAKTKTNGATPPPMFVLDRQRLAAYSDETREFDNRYLARIPPPAEFARMHVKEIWYVAPPGTSVESDDLNDFFVAPNLTQTVQWAAVDSFDAPATSSAPGLYRYDARPRATWFSTGRPGTVAAFPQAFGVVPIAVGIGTGIVLGAKLSRSGSFLRATSSAGG